MMKVRSENTQPSISAVFQPLPNCRTKVATPPHITKSKTHRNAISPAFLGAYPRAYGLGRSLAGAPVGLVLTHCPRTAFTLQAAYAQSID